MQCPNCGAHLADGSRFCNMCGTTIAAPVAVAAANVPEQVVFTLRPTFLFVGVKYLIAAVIWLVATAVVAAVASLTKLPGLRRYKPIPVETLARLLLDVAAARGPLDEILEGDSLWHEVEKNRA